LAAALLGTLGVVLAVTFVRKHPITVSVGGTSPAVSFGASVMAPPDREVPLSFSDGSLIALAPGSEAAIDSLDHNGGTVGISRGRARVHIVHNANTHWAIQAGPYTVAVTGTRFDIEWQPEVPRFSVNLAEGSVSVSAQKRSAPARLAEGQELLVVNDTWTVRDARDVAAAVNEERPGRGPSVNPDAVAAVPESGLVEATPLVTPRAPANIQKSWALFVAQGDYRGAYEAAEREGFENVSRRSTSSELLSLAEAARFAGRADRAQFALHVLRSRFAGAHDAALAAFELGRLSGGGANSAQWFRAFLREQRSGPLVREASGRLLEALAQAGDREGARTEAQNYLRAYPQGPHAAFARRLLSQQAR